MPLRRLPPVIPKQIYRAAATIIPILQVKRLWYREVQYFAQGHTVKEPSLESSPGHLKPEPVQMAMPSTVTGQGRTSRELSRGKKECNP